MKFESCIFNEDSKFFGQELSYFFLKKSMFEASEALHKVEGTKKIKTMSFHQYSQNSEVEKTLISLIG